MQTITATDIPNNIFLHLSDNALIIYKDDDVKKCNITACKAAFASAPASDEDTEPDTATLRPSSPSTTLLLRPAAALSTVMHAMFIEASFTALSLKVKTL
jgi:hypothetical protein